MRLSAGHVIPLKPFYAGSDMVSARLFDEDPPLPSFPTLGVFSPFKCDNAVCYNRPRLIPYPFAPRAAIQQCENSFNDLQRCVATIPRGCCWLRRVVR